MASKRAGARGPAVSYRWRAGCRIILSGMGQAAVRAVGESVGLDGEGVVKARAVILPRDGGSQFDDLAFVKRGAQCFEDPVGNFDGCLRHRDGVTEDAAFTIIKQRIGFEVVQRRDLVIRQTQLSADRRPDVNSERAADHHRHFDLCQHFDLRVDRASCFLSEFHVRDGAEQPGVVGRDFDRCNHSPELALGGEVNQPGDPRGILIVDAIESSHVLLPFGESGSNDAGQLMPSILCVVTTGGNLTSSSTVIHARFSPEQHGARADRNTPMSERTAMATCETCGNTYDKSFEVVMDGDRHTFDSFECAIQALAPRCLNCGCRVIGHGMEADGQVFCCAHCANHAGKPELQDRA